MIFSLRVFESCLYSLINFLPYFFLALYPFSDKFRFSRKTNIILFISLLIFEIIICIWATLFSTNNAPVSFFNTIIFALFFFIAIKDHVGKLLFVLIVISNLANQVVFSAKCLEGYFFPALALQYNRWSFSLTTVIVQLIFLPIFFLFIKKYFKEAIDLQVQNNIWWYLWLIPGVFYLFWFYIAYFNNVSGIKSALQIKYTLFAIIINSSSLLIYYIIAKTIQEFAKNYELEFQNKQLIIQNLQYENLKNKIEQDKRDRHDFKQHMNVLHTLYKNKDYEQLDCYLQKFLKTNNFDTAISYCEHLTLNALLVYYGQLAMNNHIEFQVHISVPKDIAIENTDLTILFGNLLENAYEASLLVPIEERNIKINVSIVNKNTFVLTLDNSFVGTIQMKQEKYLSSKHKGYGIGIESVKNMVKRYNGTAKFENKNNIFYVSIILNL